MLYYYNIYSNAEEPMDLKFRVQARIRKPVAEVFDAVYSPAKLSGYFTTGGASGPLAEGTTVTWDFADFPGAFPVHVRKVVANRSIVLEWQAADGDYNTRVEMSFEPIDAGSTLVKIAESGWKETQKGLDSALGNSGGWMQMLCCLKVYLELGVNLREFLN
jgi:uncharacterized protein YndB with AHSA1/START domain